MSLIHWTEKEIEFIKKNMTTKIEIVTNTNNNITSEEIEFIKKKPSKS